MSRRARRSSQTFQRITTQPLTDMASSSNATARLTASLCCQKCSKTVIALSCRPSTSCMSNRPGLRLARKRAARRLPWA